jgi:hypothetical protein
MKIDINLSNEFIKCIDYLQNNPINHGQLMHFFNDEQIPVMDWIFSMARIEQESMILELGDISSSHNFSDIFLAITSRCQTVALESLYQFVIRCDIQFLNICKSVSVDTRAKSEDKIRTLNWYVSCIGFDKLLPLVNQNIEIQVRSGDVAVLKWYIDQHESTNMPFEFELKSLGINAIEILNVLYDYLGNNFKYHEDLIYKCARSIDTLIEIINWLYDHSDRIEFRYGKSLFTTHIIVDPQITVLLNWFWDHRRDVEFKDSTDAINRASQFNAIDVLNWFWDRRHETTFGYTCHAIDYCSHVDILNW